LDHCVTGLPKPWRPTRDYELKLTDLKWKPTSRIRDETPESTALWKKFVQDKQPSWLNFSMISVLAEHVLALNPLVLHALRGTYAYVFLDEFQDTTNLQYELTKTAFLGSSAVVTAVGDPKQRIMQWAGALSGIFGKFKSDFDAGVLRPMINYRSDPELVRIQGFLAAALENKPYEVEAPREAASKQGECRILSFEDSDAEAKCLASYVKDWMESDDLGPRDICVLTRNRPPDYTSVLQSELRKIGIVARVESELQDLLSEPLTSMLLDLLRLAANPRAPVAWTNSLEVLQRTSDSDSEESARDNEQRLSRIVKKLRLVLKATDSEEPEIKEVLLTIVSFVGKKEFLSVHPQYIQGQFFSDTIQQIAGHLSRFRRALDWRESLDEFEGIRALPIMTIHKSKGLEYHTVIFVGFEDSAFWGYQKNPGEETCAFFVAFSRAKRRVIFTFCEQRERPPGTPSQRQERAAIRPLYEILKQAGVLAERITDP
jgi:superfamily I DNA/RNA helicase